MYGTLQAWRAYALARGNSAPTDADEATADAARQRASDYIRLRYVSRYGLDGTSDEVEEATYIAAAEELSSPGFWRKTFTPAQMKTLTKADVISWTPIEQEGYRGADLMQPVSPSIEALLAPGEGSYQPSAWAIGG